MAALWLTGRMDYGCRRARVFTTLTGEHNVFTYRFQHDESNPDSLDSNAVFSVKRGLVMENMVLESEIGSGLHFGGIVRAGGAAGCAVPLIRESCDQLPFDGIIGNSEALRRVLEQVERVRLSTPRC